MYKIFINEKPFIISKDDVSDERFINCKRIHFKAEKIIELIKDVEKNNSAGIVLIVADEEKCFNDFNSNFISIEASGGVVFNDKKELLLIKRLGKWDLPKGKIEGNENVEEAAIREVEEECGIDKLTIATKLEQSFHTYKLHNHRFLKITHWFLMTTKTDKKLIPQTDENITEAKWIDRETLDLKKLDTYSSIRDLLLSIQ